MREMQAWAATFSSVAVYENHPRQNKPNKPKTKLKPKENSQTYLKSDFLVAVISGLIPFWKLMRNCQLSTPGPLQALHNKNKLPYDSF